jgi:hypothetical protein
MDKELTNFLRKSCDPKSAIVRDARVGNKTNKFCLHQWKKIQLVQKNMTAKAVALQISLPSLTIVIFTHPSVTKNLRFKKGILLFEFFLPVQTIKAWVKHSLYWLLFNEKTLYWLNVSQMGPPRNINAIWPKHARPDH